MIININKNTDIMFHSQRIILIGCILFVPMTGVFAAGSSEKGESTAKTSGHATSDHPPHDHQHHDHIKKLDEGMQRRKNKKLN